VVAELVVAALHEVAVVAGLVVAELVVAALHEVAVVAGLVVAELVVAALHEVARQAGADARHEVSGTRSPIAAAAVVTSPSCTRWRWSRPSWSPSSWSPRCTRWRWSRTSWSPSSPRWTSAASWSPSSWSPRCTRWRWSRRAAGGADLAELPASMPGDPVVAVLEAAGRVDTPGGYPREAGARRWRAQACARFRAENTYMDVGRVAQEHDTRR
jgi:hypothetical protein